MSKMSDTVSGTIFINNEFRGVKDKFSFNFIGPGDVENIKKVSQCAIAQRNANTDAATAKMTAFEYAIAFAAFRQAITQGDSMLNVASALDKVIMTKNAATIAANNATETAELAKAIKVITTATFILNTNATTTAAATATAAATTAAATTSSN